MLKYIGDFDKLKDYGFELYDEYALRKTDFKYINNQNKEDYDDIYISNDGDISWNYVYNETLEEAYIQDLIKDGLVIKE